MASGLAGVTMAASEMQTKAPSPMPCLAERREMAVSRALFKVLSEAPPLSHPPGMGMLRWTQSIFVRNCLRSGLRSLEQPQALIPAPPSSSS